MAIKIKPRAPAHSRRKGVITLSVEVPRALHTKLQKICLEEERSISAYCRRLIEAHLK